MSYRIILLSALSSCMRHGMPTACGFSVSSLPCLPVSLFHVGRTMDVPNLPADIVGGGVSEY